jgi:hypothetical protein
MDEITARSFSWTRLRKMQRRMQWQRWTPLLIVGGTVLAYWQKEYLGFPSDIGFYAVAILILLGFHHVECRLDAVQLRLASMHDRLDAIAGVEPQYHTEAEIDARPG